MSAQPVDVLAYHDALIAQHKALSADAYHVQELPKAEAVRAAMAELVEAGNVLRQIQMHTAPWYEKGQRQAYARLVGVPETSSRRTIEQAADDRFDAALARVSGGAA